MTSKNGAFTVLPGRSARGLGRHDILAFYAFAERFVGTVRRDPTDRMIFVGTTSLDRALRAFVVHDNAIKQPAVLGQRPSRAGSSVGSVLGRHQRRGRLGGLPSFYVRRAA